MWGSSAERPERPTIAHMSAHSRNLKGRGLRLAVMDDGRVGRGENPLEFGQRGGGGG